MTSVLLSAFESMPFGARDDQREPGHTAMQATRDATRSLAGMPRAQQLVDAVRADPTAQVTAGIIGPGGCGKTALLEVLRCTYLDAGIPVVGAEALVNSTAGPADAALLIDNAQDLPSWALERVEEYVRAGARTILAFRPWPRPPALIAAASAVRWSGPLVVLGHLDREQIEQRALVRTGVAPPPALLDFLEVNTGGLPALIDLVLHQLPASLGATNGPDQVVGPLTDGLVDRARALLLDLDGPCFDLVHAVAVGSDLDADLLSTVLGVDASAVRDAIDQARATGLLLQSGRVPPLTARALIKEAPAERTRAVRAALLHAQQARGGDVVGLARTLVEHGSRDPRLAALLVGAADRELNADPERALLLYEEARQAGASHTHIALRQAEAAALAGRFDAAMRLADTVLAGPWEADTGRAIDVSAVVLAARGQLGRAAELYTWLGGDRIGPSAGMAALAFAGTGATSNAAALIASGIDAGPPTVVAGASRAMAKAVWESIVGRPLAAMGIMARAAALLESLAPHAVLLLDSPAALTAVMALHCGRLDIAESTLDRALRIDVGGPTFRRRHVLLLGFTAMLAGRLEQARELLEQGMAGERDHPLEPRELLLSCALELGVARRSSDMPNLVRAWSRAREVLPRLGVDLYSVLPLTELIVAAARLDDSDSINPLVDEMSEILDQLGGPVLWAAPLHWAGVQAGILHNRPAELKTHAAALVAAAETNSVAAILTAASKAWVDVLKGSYEPHAVQQAATQLRTIGLAWDGSRLLGQAAARSTDRREATALLQAARALSDTVEPAPAPLPASAPLADAATATARSAGPSPFGLSQRESEVAHLLLSQQTYREIGERLYISAKTVEHHVARIKQRVGAESRADLVWRLRGALGDASN